MTPKQARLIVFSIILICFVWAIFIWVKNHGFIQVNVLGKPPGETSFVLKNEDTGKETTMNSSDGSFKKFIRKGSYTITANQDNKKAILLIQSKGYFKSVSKSQALKSENLRSFIGAEPNTCMEFIKILYSYDCDSTYDTLKKHMPGTQFGPTYTQNGEANNTTNILAIRELNGSPYIITQDTSTDEDSGYTATYGKLEDDLATLSSSSLKGVPPAPSYRISDLNNNLLVYDGSLKKSYEFSDITASPKKIDLEGPKTNDLEAVQLSTYNGDIGTYFSEPYLGSEIVGKTDNTKMIKGKSEFIVRNKTGKSEHFLFNTIYQSGLLCGEKRICLTAKQRLHIYDISTSKPKLVYIMSDVKAVNILGSSMIINTSYGILSLTPELVGYPVYTLGEYTYCGSRMQNKYIIVCVADKSNRRNALLIDTTQDDIDGIDKKIVKLSKLDSVKTLSIYQNYIYIVQNAGEREYITEKKGFFYPQFKIDAATNRIKQEINATGIGALPYSIQYNY
jgi:hypothetical protein